MVTMACGGGSPLCLYAVVRADEARGLDARVRGLRRVVDGPVAAIVGRPRTRDARRAALEHDRVVGRALMVCTSLVPFRFGVNVRSEAELYELLRANVQRLCRLLDRLRGRVEMGLKAGLTARGGGDPVPAPSALVERVRALAPRRADRRERLERSPSGTIFSGSYLIPRVHIEAFWSALAVARCELPGVPLLGSGPWAAYSFCDLTFRPGGGHRARTERACAI